MQNEKTPKGFRDFSPTQMAIRQRAIEIIKKVFEQYGFSQIQTPVLEYQSTLLGKYGNEAEKLMYLFEDPGKRKVGLRYDLTVPLARYISDRTNITLPFKRYQIQPCYRAENTQKGRYREFTQCDVDIVGSSSPLADAEIIAIINDSLKALGFDNYEIKINSRTVLYQEMSKAGIPQSKYLTVAQSLDKLDKKTKKEVEEELISKGIDLIQVKKLFDRISKAKPDGYLSDVIKLSQNLGVSGKSLKFVPTLSRGLDYYTGPIFETVVNKPPIGSITGGGRYDQLFSSLGSRDLPAVGTSIGLDRVCDVIEELNLWPNLNLAPADILVTIFSEDLVSQSVTLSTSLRNLGLKTQLYFDSKDKLSKQFKYADKNNIPWVAVVGPEEVKNNQVIIKNMAKGTQETISFNDLGNFEFG